MMVVSSAQAATFFQAGGLATFRATKDGIEVEVCASAATAADRRVMAAMVRDALASGSAEVPAAADVLFTR